MRKKELASFDFSTIQSSMQIQRHFQCEDIDVSSAVIPLLNEIIHTSIKKIFTPKRLFFSFLLSKKTMTSCHLSDLTTDSSSDLPKSH